MPPRIPGSRRIPPPAAESGDLHPQPARRPGAHRFPWNSVLVIIAHPGGSMYLTRSKSRALAVGVIITLIMGFAGCVATPPAPPAPAPPSVADYSFEELAQRYLAEVLALTPVAATALGEHRYDSNLDDVSAAGFTHRAALTRELLAQLDLLQTKLLSRAHQVDAHLLRNELEYELWRIERLQEWRWNPLLYTDL